MTLTVEKTKETQLWLYKGGLSDYLMQTLNGDPVIPLFEGSGHADKVQIAMMVGILLPGVNAKADAADALAVAICHAHHRGAASLQRMLVHA